MELHLKHNATLTNLVSRIEHHGEDRVNAVTLDIAIKDMPAGELDQFALDDNLLSTTLWCPKDNVQDLAGGYDLGGPKLPLLVTPLSISRDFEKHKAVVAMESPDSLKPKDRGEIQIYDASVKKIKFTPKQHGLADMTLQVSGKMEGMEQGRVIAKYLQERISIEIQPGEESQQTLLDDDASQADDSKSDQGAAAATA